MALSALATVYRPRVYGYAIAHSDEEEAAWRQFDASNAASAMLEWLGWTAGHVRDVAERLLQRARHVDPLAEWQSLVRLISTDTWAELRGDALVAMDFRIAAEMPFRFHEDLVAQGAAAPRPLIPDRFRQPLQERLKTTRTELDEGITDFGLSPHPSLVLVLECATEMVCVPRVMDLLGVARWRDYVDILQGCGVGTHVGFLAKYVSTPRLGRAVGRDVLLERPVTHFFVVVDPEGPFRTTHGCEEERKEVGRENTRRTSAGQEDRHRKEAERRSGEGSNVGNTFL